eukprot:GHVN01057022.1.p3 GENE.GHVN01057022.1~~GHVN01057022.1.p3  ORF type:complete len:373 (-),score=43.66 GHVN01057022.1:2018-3136(-)
MTEPLSASSLLLSRCEKPTTSFPAKESLKFGEAFTDHMLEVDWDAQHGWSDPRIIPFQNLSLHPAVSSLHYGLQVFEGMKAFRSHKDDKVRLFRPELNVSRMLISAERLALPTFEPRELLVLIKKLVDTDKAWCPRGEGYSLYIRPTCISTQPSLPVAPPRSAKLFVILSPVGPYFPTGFKPVSLLADVRYVRAYPGGVGDAKVGGNYAPTIRPQLEATKQGFSNMLWLLPDGNDYQMTECGAMNFFMLWKNERGVTELVTPPLTSNTILPGVTRESVLGLAKAMEGVEVAERTILISKDFITAVKEKRVMELFGTGTAVNVVSINKVRFEGVDYEVPVDEKVGMGEFAANLRQQLQNIQNGVVDHEWMSDL